MFEHLAAESARFDRVLRPDIAETPLVRRPEFDKVGITVVAKLENKQPTGSFKLRGATAKIDSLAQAQLDAGVVAASTGNHGAAVAQAAANRGTTAEIFVSAAADPGKVKAIRSLGGRISSVPGDPVNAEREARRTAEASARPYISPYNDPVVIAGQGTVGIELIRQSPGLAGVIVSVGGGGLISGIAAAVKRHRSEIRIVAASAANSAAMHHSVLAGAITDIEHDPTLSDGTAGGIERGSVTFGLCRSLVDEWLLVEEEAIAETMRRYMSRNDDRIEGSAGVALAAVALTAVRGRLAVIVCGGNVSDETLERAGVVPRRPGGPAS